MNLHSIGDSLHTSWLHAFDILHGTKDRGRVYEKNFQNESKIVNNVIKLFLNARSLEERLGVCKLPLYQRAKEIAQKRVDEWFLLPRVGYSSDHFDFDTEMEYVIVAILIPHGGITNAFIRDLEDNLTTRRICMSYTAGGGFAKVALLELDKKYPYLWKENLTNETISLIIKNATLGAEKWTMDAKILGEFLNGKARDPFWAEYLWRQDDMQLRFFVIAANLPIENKQEQVITFALAQSPWHKQKIFEQIASHNVDYISAFYSQLTSEERIEFFDDMLFFYGTAKSLTIMYTFLSKEERSQSLAGELQTEDASQLYETIKKYEEGYQLRRYLGEHRSSRYFNKEEEALIPYSY